MASSSPSGNRYWWSDAQVQPDSISSVSASRVASRNASGFTFLAQIG